MAEKGFVGPLQLKDPAKKNGHKSATSPQVRHVPLFDSRLHNKFDRHGVLVPHRVRELRRDPTISMMRDIILAPVVHTEWTVIADDDAPEEAKDFIHKVFMPLRLDFLQRAFFGCVDYGWAPFEKVLIEKDGNIIISKLKGLLQDFSWVLVYVDTGEFAGFINTPIDLSTNIEEVYLDINESLNINFEVEGTDWYGQSVLGDLDEAQRDWDQGNASAIRYNTKVAGAHWIVYFPVGATSFNGVETDNQTIAMALIDTLESNGAVCVPDDIMEYLGVDSMDNEARGKWRVELLSDSSNSQITFTDRQKYLDTLKVRAFGIPERSVLEGKFGTKAEAEVHADMGLATIDTKHRQVVAQLNAQAVKQMMRLNFGEEVENTVRLAVAPLVDSRFAVLKESFRLLMQSPNTIDTIMPQLDLRAMMEELSLPHLSEEEAEAKEQEIFDKKMERQQQMFQTEGGEDSDEDDADPSKGNEDPPGQNPRQKEENAQDKG